MVAAGGECGGEVLDVFFHAADVGVIESSEKKGVHSDLRCLLVLYVQYPAGSSPFLGANELYYGYNFIRMLLTYGLEDNLYFFYKCADGYICWRRYCCLLSDS